MSKGEPTELEISVSSETVVRIVFILGLFALAWFLRDILVVVLTAVILASAIEPLVRFFAQRNIPRLLALVLIYTSGGASLLCLVYFFVPAILADVSQMARALPTYIDISSLWNPLASGVDGDAVRTITPATGIERGLSDGANVVDLLKSGIEQGGIIQSASAFFGGFLSFVLIVVLSFYLSAQERGVEHFLRLISPAKSRGYIVDLWKRSQAKIGLWFQGQVLLGVLVGVLTFLGLTIMGVPSALFLAVLIMIFELIPVFGPILAAVPAVAVAFTDGIRVADPGLTAALIVGVFYFIIQQFESHLIYPLVVRKVIGIPPVLVILALVIGAKMAGFLGILLSVPVTAILMEFLNDVAKEKRIFED
jgi:predicted PurR-regulated permease PerM